MITGTIKSFRGSIKVHLVLTCKCSYKWIKGTACQSLINKSMVGGVRGIKHFRMWLSNRFQRANLSAPSSLSSLVFLEPEQIFMEDYAGRQEFMFQLQRKRKAGRKVDLVCNLELCMCVCFTSQDCLCYSWATSRCKYRGVSCRSWINVSRRAGIRKSYLPHDFLRISIKYESDISGCLETKRGMALPVSVRDEPSHKNRSLSVKSSTKGLQFHCKTL